MNQTAANRTSDIHAKLTRVPSNNVEFDYENQAWLIDGVYQNCGHSLTLPCGCYGRIHQGQTKVA